jgi:hypothetical protein
MEIMTGMIIFTAMIGHFARFYPAPSPAGGFPSLVVFMSSITNQLGVASVLPDLSNI